MIHSHGSFVLQVHNMWHLFFSNIYFLLFWYGVNRVAGEFKLRFSSESGWILSLKETVNPSNCLPFSAKPEEIYPGVIALASSAGSPIISIYDREAWRWGCDSFTCSHFWCTLSLTTLSHLDLMTCIAQHPRLQLWMIHYNQDCPKPTEVKCITGMSPKWIPIICDIMLCCREISRGSPVV